MHALLEEHLPRLRAYVRLRCGAALRAKESASDLVQSACRDVLANMGGFRWEGEAAFRGWLYTAASRKVADRAEYWQAKLRDVRREEPGDGDLALLDVYRRSATPSQVAMGKEALERIERAFDELSDDYREAVVLARVLGLPRAEVARRMGKTEDAVRHLLFRGLAQLGRKILD
ncbi:MAG: sigma-70 family RNA polymerase sigma factor [Planctomycetes bacterium]|nr:sigma-70 family RNA polymerase sigma factor [Planctomycetota bacterium]